MTERIRLRVWLLGLGPVVVVGGVLIVLFVGSGRKPASRAAVTATDPAASAQAVAETSQAIVAQAPPPIAPPVPPPPAAPPMVAAAASSVILAGPPPEPIPELDALRRPQGSESWTTEQKLAYREQAFQALDAKERSLEQEVAIAKRRGDSQAVQEKQATLDYLRAWRAQIQEMMRRRDPLRDAPQDAGS